jgi:hypothetical protein
MAYKRGGGFQDPNAKRVIEIEEQFYGFKQMAGVSTPGAQMVLGQVGTSAGSTLPSIFGNNVTPAGATFVSVAGRPILQIASGAAILSRVDATGDRAAVPISQQFNGVDALGTQILMNRPFRRYTLSVPVRRTVGPGTTRLEFGLVTSTNMLTFAGTPPGLAWSSDPAVNAGRWLPRLRIVNAGAITDGNDSAVVVTAWHTLEVRYTEGPAATLEWIIDDSILRTVSGDANMPVFPGGVNHPGFVPGYGLSTPAGATWQFGAGRLRIEDV